MACAPTKVPKKFAAFSYEQVLKDGDKTTALLLSSDDATLQTKGGDGGNEVSVTHLPLAARGSSNTILTGYIGNPNPPSMQKEMQSTLRSQQALSHYKEQSKASKQTHSTGTQPPSPEHPASMHLEQQTEQSKDGKGNGNEQTTSEQVQEKATTAEAAATDKDDKEVDNTEKSKQTDEDDEADDSKTRGTEAQPFSHGHLGLQQPPHPNTAVVAATNMHLEQQTEQSKDGKGNEQTTSEQVQAEATIAEAAATDKDDKEVDNTEKSKQTDEDDEADDSKTRGTEAQPFSDDHLGLQQPPHPNTAVVAATNTHVEQQTEQSKDGKGNEQTTSEQVQAEATIAEAAATDKDDKEVDNTEKSKQTDEADEADDSKTPGTEAQPFSDDHLGLQQPPHPNTAVVAATNTHLEQQTEQSKDGKGNEQTTSEQVQAEAIIAEAAATDKDDKEVDNTEKSKQTDEADEADDSKTPGTEAQPFSDDHLGLQQPPHPNTAVVAATNTHLEQQTEQSKDGKGNEQTTSEQVQAEATIAEAAATDKDDKEVDNTEKSKQTDEADEADDSKTPGTEAQPFSDDHLGLQQPPHPNTAVVAATNTHLEQQTEQSKDGKGNEQPTSEQVQAEAIIAEAAATGKDDEEVDNTEKSKQTDEADDSKTRGTEAQPFSHDHLGLQQPPHPNTAVVAATNTHLEQQTEQSKDGKGNEQTTSEQVQAEATIAEAAATDEDDEEVDNTEKSKQTDEADEADDSKTRGTEAQPFSHDHLGLQQPPHPNTAASRPRVFQKLNMEQFSKSVVFDLESDDDILQPTHATTAADRKTRMTAAKSSPKRPAGHKTHAASPSSYIKVEENTSITSPERGQKRSEPSGSPEPCTPQRSTKQKVELAPPITPVASRKRRRPHTPPTAKTVKETTEVGGDVTCMMLQQDFFDFLGRQSQSQSQAFLLRSYQLTKLPQTIYIVVKDGRACSYVGTINVGASDEVQRFYPYKDCFPSNTDRKYWQDRVRDRQPVFCMAG